MALQQLNLKLPPEVAAHWSAQARAEGLSVRDWLIARVGPAAGPAPAAGAELLERLQALEATTTQLAAAVALLQASPRRSPERVSQPPRTGEPVEPLRVPLGAGVLEIIGANHLHPPAPEPPSPERVRVAALPGDALPQRRLTPAEAAGLLTTPEVGEALGLASDSALTNWIAREASKRGGSAVGGIYRGHRLRGKGLLPGGQKPGWLWEPVEA